MAKPLAKLSAKPSPSFEKLLLRILSKPTTPFCESWVQREFRNFFHENKLPWYEDEFGNLWLGVNKKSKVAKTHLIFVAHMDHPGFAIRSFSIDKKNSHWFCEGLWFGGGPTEILGRKVKVFPTHTHGLWKNFSAAKSPPAFFLEGRISSVKAGQRSVSTARIEVPFSDRAKEIFNTAPAKNKHTFAWGACLQFDELDAQGTLSMDSPRGILRTKAADDLVGACLFIQAYCELRRKNPSATKGVALLLTRAEENGFHGTLAALRTQKLNPRQTMMISIETSSQLPGAEIGKGPVIRLGDRATVFSPAATRFVQMTAQKLSGLKFQRRVMDGGSCEATAFNCFGFDVAGISVPLGGYHNVGKDQKAIPEEVSLEDVISAKNLVMKLIEESKFIKLKAWRDEIFKDLRKSLTQSNDEYLKILKGK